MDLREFIAVEQPSVDLAAWAAAPYGWRARPAPRSALVMTGSQARAVELSHPRAPVPVIVLEGAAPRAPRETADGGIFLYVDLPVEDAYRLDSLLRNTAIRQLFQALGAVARKSRLSDPAA